MEIQSDTVYGVFVVGVFGITQGRHVEIVSVTEKMSLQTLRVRFRFGNLTGTELLGPLKSKVP